MKMTHPLGRVGRIGGRVGRVPWWVLGSLGTLVGVAPTGPVLAPSVIIGRAGVGRPPYADWLAWARPG